MLKLLIRIFIKDGAADAATRRKYAVLCGSLGVALNIMLFAGKLAVGAMTGSIALTADAFNNLSDAGSSAITIFGFKLAGKAADREHPFGHGRIEYLAGLFVAAAIIVMGVELGVSSFENILSPAPVEYSTAAVIVLCASIAVKLYMAYYNKKIGKQIFSATLLAAGTDSMSDVAATLLVLVSVIMARFTAFPVDGYAGLAVAAFILISGIKAGRDTVAPLLGAPPTREFVEETYRIVLSHSPIMGVHDLRVHNYGPGRVIISLHAEVPCDSSLTLVHEVIDNVEYDLSVALDCEAVIHVDPIDTADDELNRLRAQVAQILNETDAGLTMHDFRTVRGKSHLNVIFDIVSPAECTIDDDRLKATIESRVDALSENYHCTVKIDKSFE